MTIGVVKRSPPPKPPLMGLGNLGKTFDIHAKPIEMDIQTLEHANHHPAQGFEVTGIAPHNASSVEPSAIQISSKYLRAYLTATGTCRL